MKIKAQDLITHIEKASVGGLINELVLDKDFQFVVTDDSKSILSISNSANPNNDLGEIGLFDLGLVVKSIQYVSGSIFNTDEELELAVVDNRLVFKKNENEFKFLLSNPKVISSTVENITETMKKLRSVVGVTFVLEKSIVENLIKAIQLIVPEKIVIYVKDKKVLALVGKETEHNAILCLTTLKEDSDLKVSMKPDYFLKVLQVLPIDSEVKVELRNSYPIIFTSKDYSFVVAPIQEEKAS